MIHHVRRDHSRNKSEPVHEKSSFPKECDEYTTKRLMRQELSFDFVADYCPKVIMSHTAAILIISLFREKIGMGTPVISCNPEPSRESRLSGFVPVRYHHTQIGRR